MNKYIVEPFLYRKIIIEKSENIVINMTEPVFEKTIIESNVDGNPDISIFEYAKIMLIGGEFKLYYRGLIDYNISWNLIRCTDTSTPYECFCLLTSEDGLNFKKINANLVNYKNSKNNNIIRLDSFCHNFFPYYDKKTDLYIGISGTGLYNNGLFLFNSNDGLKWDDGTKIIDTSKILPGYTHPNHFDSHNSILYNEVESRYYLFVRHNKPEKRWVQYFYTKDFINFSYPQEITVDNLTISEHIYNIGAINYPGNKELFIGMSMIGDEKEKKITLFSSKNLHDWQFNYETLFENIDESQKFIVNGIVPSTDNRKLYIYLFEDILEKKKKINCYSFGMNRLQKISCNDNSFGFIKTDLINLSNINIKVNFETFDDGFIQLELINENFETVLIGKKMSGNELELENKWDVECVFYTKKFYIKFIIFKANLYSFHYQ